MKPGYQKVLFDVSFVFVTVLFIVTWAMDWIWLYVPLACLLALALATWERPMMRRLRRADDK